MKKIFIRVISGAAAVIMMAVIFFMSAQTSSVSGDMSYGLTDKILSHFDSYNKLDDTEKTEVLEKTENTVRKSAHFSEFMLLAVLVMLFIRSFDKGIIPSGAISVAFSAFYAGTDEFHQSFVPGRGCMFTDVLIDTAGALFGVLILSLLILIISRVKRKKKNQK